MTGRQNTTRLAIPVNKVRDHAAGSNCQESRYGLSNPIYASGHRPLEYVS
jgi:hypothetical protein